MDISDFSVFPMQWGVKPAEPQELVDLALHADAQPIRASDIARRTMIPEPFLAQVMHAMGKNGIVRAQRGPQGGHALAMKPEEIRLSMVMDSLGSSENLMACLENTTSCVHVPSCSQREVWESVETAVYEILDTRTIADLVTRSRAMTGDETRESNRQDIAVQSANN